MDRKGKRLNAFTRCLRARVFSGCVTRRLLHGGYAAWTIVNIHSTDRRNRMSSKCGARDIRQRRDREESRRCAINERTRRIIRRGNVNIALPAIPSTCVGARDEERRKERRGQTEETRMHAEEVSGCRYTHTHTYTHVNDTYQRILHVDRCDSRARTC